MALFRKIVENQSRGCETCGDITKKKHGGGQFMKSWLHF